MPVALPLLTDAEPHVIIATGTAMRKGGSVAQLSQNAPRSRSLANQPHDYDHKENHKQDANDSPQSHSAHHSIHHLLHTLDPPARHSLV